MTVCVVLAAGRSIRMGAPKLLLAIDGASLLTRALAATAGFPCVVVASPELTQHLPDHGRVTVVVNDAPERGMTHSLALANAAVADPAAALVVLLADTPFVDAELVRRIVDARGDADVAYPIRDGVPGHPVAFGPRPRAAIADLPDGDTLRRLRTDVRWSRIEVALDDDRAFADVDTPGDLRRLRAREVPREKR